MYGNMTVNSAKNLLAVTAFQYALLDEKSDALGESKVLNGMLREMIERQPEQAEYNILDTIQSVFNALRASCSSRDEFRSHREKLEAVCADLMDGVEYVPFQELWDIQEAFVTLKKGWLEHADTEARLFDSAARCEGRAPVLAYLIRREMLNQMLQTGAFVSRRDRVGALAAALEAAPKNVVEVAEEIGADLFFLGSVGGWR